MKKIIIRFNAPVILSFALLSLIALLLGNWTNGAATTQYFSVYRSSLADPLTYVRFFGHVLGHSGYDHYMGNMLLLLLVGPGLEEKYGSGTMVWMIALTALVTGLVNFIFFPHTALLGASGVVFMMIVLSSFTAARKGEIPVTLILVVIFYLGGEIMDGLFKQDNVSQIAHIVGGLCGTMVWMIALTALVTGLVNFIFFPHTALLGASGVVFMMIVLSSFTAARKGEIPVTLILVVIFYLGGEIMDGLFKQDNVSQIAHIVGGLCGLVFGFTVRRGRR